MSWVRVCPLSELAAGETRLIEIAGDSVLICRLGADEVCAIENSCTHDDGPLQDGRLDGRTIECPRHGARFDVASGAVLSLPAPTGLVTYPVRISDDGWVEVNGDGRP